MERHVFGRGTRRRESWIEPPRHAAGRGETYLSAERSTQQSFGFDEAKPPSAAPLELGASRIFVGTCGYSYKDWVGTFYPERIKPDAMLPFYSEHFSAVEIDATYYRIPAESTFASMAARTPPGFRFSVKMPGSVTHVPGEQAGAVSDDARFLRENVQPLVADGKLSALLLQFPNRFKPVPRTHAYLAAIREAVVDVPLVAEFRNAEWQRPETLQLLGELDIGWCNVDQPRLERLLHPSSDVVGPLAYARLHGRNASNWWKKGENADHRFDYLYNEDELLPWTERVADMAGEAKETLVFFNNHRLGQAPKNAAMLLRMLRLTFLEAD